MAAELANLSSSQCLRVEGFANNLRKPVGEAVEGFAKTEVDLGGRRTPMVMKGVIPLPRQSTPGFAGFVCSVKKPIACSTFTEVSSVHHRADDVCQKGSNQERAPLR
jgi:hypothetical protein